jgi:hypothetical protein
LIIPCHYAQTIFDIGKRQNGFSEEISIGSTDFVDGGIVEIIRSVGVGNVDFVLSVSNSYINILTSTIERIKTIE